MRKERKNEYVIFRNGVHYDNFLWDSCIGYSCVLEEVRRMEKLLPSDKWEAVKRNELIKQLEK